MVDDVSSFGLLDPSLSLAKGSVIGHKAVNKFGRNQDIDTALEDLWDAGGTWVAPTQARIHQITSDSTSDTSAGAGAKTIRIYGLTDWDTAETSEVITMAGTSNVATAAYVIIHRMMVMIKGVIDVNVGTITATADTDATVTAQILPSQGQSQMAIYGIPSIQTAYLTAAYGSINKATASGGVDLNLRFNPEPQTELLHFRTVHVYALQATGVSAFRNDFNPYDKFEGPGIIKLTAQASAVNFDVAAGFNLILVDNEA